MPADSKIMIKKIEALPAERRPHSYGLKPGTAIYHTLLDVITIEDLCTVLPGRFRRIRGITEFRTGGGGAPHRSGAAPPRSHQ
jgi:hypothetical protein